MPVTRMGHAVARWCDPCSQRKNCRVHFFRNHFRLLSIRRSRFYVGREEPRAALPRVRGLPVHISYGQLLDSIIPPESSPITLRSPSDHSAASRGGPAGIIRPPERSTWHAAAQRECEKRIRERRQRQGIQSSGFRRIKRSARLLFKCGPGEEKDGPARTAGSPPIRS